ncbi:helix-turn-helix domain-containing protein [Saccharopolyspora shandongensis]|uniref:AraC-like ligand-binding domain-containing protein n=1 Tax=Saccharopolyspora shandongensis TaxID=418495 RepID=UPI0033D98B8B
MRIALTTTSVPDGDKLAFWNQAITRTLGPQAVTPRNNDAFAGRLTAGFLGYLKVATIEADAQRMIRMPQHAARLDREFVSIGLQEQGRSELIQGSRTARLSPGDLVVYKTSHPYTLDQYDRFRMHLFHVPRQAVALSNSDIYAVAATTLPAESGVATMLAPLLSMLARNATSCPPRVGEQLAGTVTDLLAMLISERIEEDESAGERSAGQVMTRRVREYVNQHLADPDLSPEAIAAHHRISVRYLHKIFEGEGTTISRWIQRRRLEECSRELAQRRRVIPTVSAVAQRWGFVNPAHFSRVFRAAYGMSPREWRNAAAPQEAEPTRS